MVKTSRTAAVELLENLRYVGASDKYILNYLIKTWMSGPEALEALEDYEMYEI